MCAVMFALAARKTGTGKALDDPVLKIEGRVTLIDACLADAMLVGLRELAAETAIVLAELQARVEALATKTERENRVPHGILHVLPS